MRQAKPKLMVKEQTPVEFALFTLSLGFFVFYILFQFSIFYFYILIHQREVDHT